MSLLDRHLAFVHALRAAGLPVSLAEDLDAARALTQVGWADREIVRATYRATLVKRQALLTTFEEIFELFFPALVGADISAAGAEEIRDGPKDSGPALSDFRDQLASALAADDTDRLRALATEAVGRFGAMPGRGPGQASWSAYTALQRVDPDSLIGQLLDGLAGPPLADHAQGERRIASFRALVEADARRRLAEEKGADYVARATLRLPIEQLDFTAARQQDLAELRRQIQPLARRLATRLTRERQAAGRGALDFRRTTRASLSTGGVPLVTHHRARRPHRAELVVLCDVSGSVANFAQFTLMLVYALREQFSKVRAFTFVDTVHEVTETFRPSADPGEVLAELAASARHAALWGRTDYGRSFAAFLREHRDALGPKTSLLVLGDARSNHSDLNLEDLREMVRGIRHAHWLNPESRRAWGSGDSAAPEYAEVVPMHECRNLTQLGEFVHDLV